jgi:epoxyqueuosine reductase QueG
VPFRRSAAAHPAPVQSNGCAIGASRHADPWRCRCVKKRSVRDRRRKNARTLAQGFLVMTDEEFRAAFKGSPMKRAKLRGLKRNAAVVLGNVGDGLGTAGVLP